jgi:pseudoazurin
MMKISHLIMTGLLSTAACNVAFAAEHEVKMLNSGKDGTMVFEPGFLKVAAGDTVKIVPTDAGHNASSVITPEGGEAWKGAIGKEVSIKMDKEGIYIYVCDPHAMMAMVGVVQVGKATNLEAAKKSAKDLSAKFVMSKDRLDKYLAQVK